MSDINESIGVTAAAVVGGDGDGNEELPDSERLTEEEMKKNILEQTEGLRNLVDTYQRQHQQMQEEVAEFIVRDVEEQNSMHSIARTVLEAQRTSLSNPNYIRWANANKKGEFAEKSVDGIEAPPVQASGVVGEPDIVMQAAQQDAQGMCAFGKLDLLDRRVLDVIKGFRGLPTPQKAGEIIAQLELFVDQCINRVKGSCGGTQTTIVPFLNGSVLWPAQAFLDGVAGGTTTAPIGGDSSPQVRYAQWMSFMVSTYLQVSNTSTSLAKMVVAALLGCVWTSEGTLQAVDAARDAVGAKMHDEDNYLVLAVLPNSTTAALLPTTHLRVFVSGGDIVVMDTIGPALNPFDGASSSSSSDQLAADWCDRVRADTLAFLDRHHIPEGGLAISWLINSTTAVSSGDDASSSNAPILINCAAISPELPFNSYQSLTWTDLCGLVASAASNKSAGLVVEGGAGPLRYVQMRVVDLTPFDAISNLWFPQLNGKPSSNATTAVETPTTTSSTPVEAVEVELKKEEGTRPTQISNVPNEQQVVTVANEDNAPVAVQADGDEKVIVASQDITPSSPTTTSTTPSPQPPSSSLLTIGAGFALTAIVAGVGGFAIAKRSLRQ